MQANPRISISSIDNQQVVDQCQLCKRQLQKITDIRTCKRCDNKGCDLCIRVETQSDESKRGKCEKCITLESVQFNEEYLDGQCILRLKEICSGLGIHVDTHVKTALIDSILSVYSTTKDGSQKVESSKAPCMNARKNSASHGIASHTNIHENKNATQETNCNISNVKSLTSTYENKTKGSQQNVAALRPKLHYATTSDNSGRRKTEGLKVNKNDTRKDHSDEIFDHINSNGIKSDSGLIDDSKVTNEVINECTADKDMKTHEFIDKTNFKENKASLDNAPKENTTVIFSSQSFKEHSEGENKIKNVDEFQKIEEDKNDRVRTLTICANADADNHLKDKNHDVTDTDATTDLNFNKCEAGDIGKKCDFNEDPQEYARKSSTDKKDESQTALIVEDKENFGNSKENGEQGIRQIVEKNMDNEGSGTENYISSAECPEDLISDSESRKKEASDEFEWQTSSESTDGINRNKSKENQSCSDEVQEKPTLTTDTANSPRNQTYACTTNNPINNATDIDQVGKDSEKVQAYSDSAQTNKTETDSTLTNKTETDSAQTNKTETDSAQTNKTETDSTQINKTETDSAQTNKTETDSTQTNKTETDSTQTNKTETDRAQTETDSAQTNKTETDSTQTNKTETDSTQTNKTETDGTQTETDSAQTNKTETDSAQTNKTETDSTQTNKTEAESTQTNKPETDSTQTETDSAQTNKTETDSAQTNKTETGSAQTNKTETDSAQNNKSETDSTQTNKTETDSAQTNKTETDSAQTNKTETDSAQNNKSETDSTQTNKTETDSAQTNKTETGSAQTNKTETDSARTNKTVTDSTRTNKTETDSAQTIKTETDGTQTNKTETDGTQTNKTETAGTQTNKTETDSTQTNKTETDSAQTNKMETDSAQTNKTETIAPKSGKENIQAKIIETIDDIDDISDIKDLSIRKLKEILKMNNVDFSGFSEKTEFVERLEQLWKDIKNSDKPLNDDNLCRICRDAPMDCILLECGHIATCTRCANELKECPICRMYIVKRVRVFRT